MRLLSSVPCFVAFVTLFFVSGVSANAVHGHPPPLPRAAVMANATLITWAPKQALPFIILGNKIYTSALTPVMSLPDDMGGVEYARWNETGARVLVGDKEILVLIDFPHRRVLHVWPQTTDACWTSEGILRISFSASGEYTLQVGSQEAALPKHMQVQATTDDGSCLLGWKSQPSVNDAPAHLNAALLFRTHGAKFILRPIHSIRWDVGSKNPYGDRLVAAGREMVISAG
ncbi:MAG: hypothetical protein JWQ02_617, partial [Capsulimonas sp.]|nr:hypothetical protein [Capsulimonas sp.]